MITTLPSQLLALTHSLCSSHAALPNVEGDRILNSEHVKALRTAYDAGLWHTPEWATAIYNGITYRLNGQHSAAMLLQLPAFPTGLSVHVKQFTCCTYEELVELFAQFDKKESMRTDAQRRNVYRANVPALKGAKQTHINDALAGIAWYSKHVDGMGIATERDKCNWMKSKADFITFIGPFCTVTRLRKSGISAAIYDTYQADKEYAKTFWQLVKDESHEDPDHPTRWLGKWLSNLASKDSNKKAKQHELYARALHCWNADLRTVKYTGTYRASDPLPQALALAA